MKKKGLLTQSTSHPTLNQNNISQLDHTQTNSEITQKDGALMGHFPESKEPPLIISNTPNCSSRFFVNSNGSQSQTSLSPTAKRLCEETRAIKVKLNAIKANIRR